MSTTRTMVDPERQMLGKVDMVGRERWEEIHRPGSSGASIRAIAREWDLDRKTVRRCLRQREWTPYQRAARSYGPFDGAVLEDLHYAEVIGAIESRIVEHSGGYRYSFSEGPAAAWIRNEETEFLDQQGENIEWVLREFGQRTVMELEMASTLVYIDRRRGTSSGTKITDVVRMVHDVKPHRPKEVIQKEAVRLREHLYATD